MATSTAPTVANEPPPVRHEPPRWHSGSAFFWGIVLILAVGFLAWFLVGYMGTSNFEDLDQQRVKERQEILRKRVEEDKHLLNDPPAYLDKEKTKIRVPLERAMQLALVQLQANKPHPAYPMTGEHLPLPAAAPTSPDKGAGSPKNDNINPPASNPTLNQSSPTPAAVLSPTPAAPAVAATPPPAASPAASATPPPANAPAASPAPPSPGTPAPSPTPAASPAPPSGTPAPAAPGNNALNPGSAPAPGTQPQPSPPPPGSSGTNGVAAPTPTGAQPQPLTSPTPIPGGPASPKEPGATPGGTPA